MKSPLITNAQESAASSSFSSSSPTLAAVPSAGPSGASSAADEPSSSAPSAAPSFGGVHVDRRSGDHSAACRWTVGHFPRVKARALWSRYFEVGGYDCRLLIYPKGDSLALPGYFSIYLQIVDPRGSSSSKWDCFASYRLSVVNHLDESKSISRDSWHRFSSKKKSHGWCDFTPSSAILDPRAGFLVNNESVIITADILILNESVSFSNEVLQPVPDVLSGKFTWKVHNFSLFREMIKTQKIMSPVFPAGECNLRISVYQSSVGGVDHLSMCLESKDTEKASDRSCWCLFRMSVLNQKPGMNHVHRDSYGRFAADNKGGDNTSLGWNDYMRMSDFVGAESGYLVDDTSVFSTSFHVIKETHSHSFPKNVGSVLGGKGYARKSVGHFGKFTWRIENFTRLKDLLKKRKITGLCVRGFRLVIGIVALLFIQGVLASEDDHDALSTDPDELIDSEDSEGISGDEEEMFRNLLSRAGFHLTYGDNPSQPQVTLREKLLMDAGAIAGFLTGLRVYLDDPAKVKRLLLPTKLSGNNGSKKDASKGDTNSPSLLNLLMGVKVLQQAIIDLLLDIMVECCQPSEARTGYDSSDTSSKPFPNSNGASTPSERSGDGEVAEYPHCRVYERLQCESDEISQAHAVQSSDLNTNGISGKTNPVQPICPPETSAADLPVDDGFIRVPKTKWPEQSEELLGLIVNSLRALDSAVPQGCPEPRRRPQLVQKISLVLDKAPRHLQPDLIALVPKLVDHSEHPLAACALLDRLQKPDAEPSLRLPVFGALSQLEFGSEVWERVLLQAFELLTESNDEPLVAAMSFVFKAASQCNHLRQAVRAVRSKLKSLGAEVPQCVLDVLTDTLHTWGDIANTVLWDIDSDCELDGNCLTTPCGIFSCGVNGLSAEEMHVGQEQVVDSCHYLSDIYILIEMVSMPGFLVNVSQIFERAIIRGAIGLRSVAMVLERRHSRRLAGKSSPSMDDSQDKQALIDEQNEALSIEDDDFTPVLSLAEVLSLSGDTRVQDFVRMLYAIMFKIYSEEQYRVRMLKVLVDGATSTSENCQVADIDMDVLVFLVREEDGIARLVLNMIREVNEVAHVERATLWRNLGAIQDENIHAQEEMQAELSNFAREKTLMTQRLSESEATTSCLKSELKAEVERTSREKKDLCEQILEGENQLEWLRSEKDEEIRKLSCDRKALQERLHDAETQLSQLKSRKRDELKRVMKEKNALAERLKNAEASRKRFDDELKRYETETVSREEVRQSLEDEVRRLTKTVGQTEGEKRDKEEQVARCEAYIDGMESRLQTCQQYIQNLENSLREEMARHAPVYGVGLESLSMKELETISHIHEEGLQQIHAIQQQRRGSGSPSLVSGHVSPQVHDLFPTSHPMPVGLPPSIIPNNVGIQGNGHMNSAAAPWFNPT